MVSLIAKASSQLVLSGGNAATPLQSGDQFLVETGVAQFVFSGVHANDWTRDTLVIPIGQAGATLDLLAGIASAAPASWQAPPGYVGSGPPSQEMLPVSVTGEVDKEFVTLTGSLAIQLPGPPLPTPPLGVAVDAASVAWSAAAKQPIVTLALAVFGREITLLRAAYTAHLHVRTPKGIPGGGGNNKLP